MSPFFFFLSLTLFIQHIFGHHPYTNIDGYDPDISTAKNVSGFRLLFGSVRPNIFEILASINTFLITH